MTDQLAEADARQAYPETPLVSAAGDAPVPRQAATGTVLQALAEDRGA